MIKRSFITIIIAVFFTGFLVPCKILSNVSAETLSGKEYIIGPEDVLEIRIWGNEDLNRTPEVSSEGEVTFPLIGKVQAGGLSVFEFENLLKKKLADGYFVSPQVTVNVIKYRSQKAYVLGEVKKPGSYIIKGQRHLLELISEAGGFTQNAGRIVTIVRPGSSATRNSSIPPENIKKHETIQVDLLDQLTLSGKGQGLVIYGGESIFVGKIARIFVTGEVKKPGEIKWEKDLTVRQAISLAGGATSKGALNRTKLIRMKNGKEKTFKPKMTDLVMPNDIINIPESYF